MIMPVFNVKQKNEVNAGERRENCSYKFYYGDNLNVPKLLHSIFPENGSSKTIVQFSLVCNIFIFWLMFRYLYFFQNFKLWVDVVHSDTLTLQITTNIFRNVHEIFHDKWVI